MANTVDIIYNNYDYAPGIATYGIDGKPGQSGKNGTSVFVCQYNVTQEDGMKKFADSIRQNIILSSNSSKVMSRPYINGDCFLFPNCDIYRMDDIDGLKTASIMNQLTDIDSSEKFMTKVGSINISQSTSGFSSSQNRLVLDTANYAGFIINTADMSEDSLSGINSPFTIVSNDIDNDGQVHFINMKSIYSGTTQSEMDIYYNSDNDAFHIESDQPIIINADVKVNQTDSVDYDQFSSVLIEDNSITSWHGVCDNISWYSIPVIVSEEVDEETGMKKVTVERSFNFINNNDTSYDNIISTATIHFTEYCTDSNIINKEAYSIGNELTEFMITNEYVIDATSDSSEYIDDNFTWEISLIGPVEIFLSQNG